MRARRRRGGGGSRGPGGGVEGGGWDGGAERAMEIAAPCKAVRLVSRGRRTSGGVRLRVRAEVLERNDILACTPGTSNLILFHTDLMGTFGTVSIEPGVEQTAYGVFSDLVSLR